MCSLFSVPFLICVSLVISVGSRFIPTNGNISKIRKSQRIYFKSMQMPNFTVCFHSCIIHWFHLCMIINSCLNNMHMSTKAKCILPIYVQKGDGKEYSDDIEPICRSVLWLYSNVECVKFSVELISSLCIQQNLWHVEFSSAVTALYECCLISCGKWESTDWSLNEGGMHHHVGRAHAVGSVVCWQQWQVQLRLAVWSGLAQQTIWPHPPWLTLVTCLVASLPPRSIHQQAVVR